MRVRSDIARMRQRGAGATGIHPGRHGLRRTAVGDPLAEFAEVNADEVEILLDDLTEEDVEEDEHEADETAAPTPRRKVAARETAEYHGGELADIWMMKGGKSPLLTPAQELVLAKRVEHGDPKAKDELV